MRLHDATHAEVEFVARYRVAGRAVRLHERSRFVCEAGRWLYVDGDAGGGVGGGVDGGDGRAQGGRPHQGRQT